MSDYDRWRTRSDRDEDERYGRTPEPEPEPEPEWEFYSGPFACLEGSIAAVHWLNDSFAGRFCKFGVWPDTASAKWIIKRRWR